MIWFSVFVCFPHHNEVVVFSWKWSNIRTPANGKPFLSNNWTHRYPLFSSEIGRQDWPSKSSFMYFSSWTSMRISANSGTVKGNSNSVSHVGVQLSSTTFVFFMTLSAGTPAIPICNQTISTLGVLWFFYFSFWWYLWSANKLHLLLKRFDCCTIISIKLHLQLKRFFTSPHVSILTQLKSPLLTWTNGWRNLAQVKYPDVKVWQWVVFAGSLLPPKAC